MALSSFTELKAAIASYMKRSTVPDVEDRIKLAEQRIKYGSGDVGDMYYSDPVRVRDMESSTTISVVVSDNSGALPSGFIGFRGPIYINGSDSAHEMHYVAPAVIRSKGNFYQDRPDEYSIIDNNIVFFPVADGSYTLNVDIYSLTALSDSNLTTDLLTNFPGIYLYGALLEAAIFYKKDADAQKYFALFKAAVQGANRDDMYSRLSGGQLMARADVYTP